MSEIWTNKIVVDVEADGPCPGLYSMVSFGAVVINEDGTITETFYGQCSPLVNADWIPAALAVSNVTRDQHISFDSPEITIENFVKWLDDINTGSPSNRIFFMSDNNGFDWQFINYYLHKFAGRNPFGHSSHNINDLYRGMTNNIRSNGKRFRRTKHTHHPIDDATGNAEIVVKLQQLGLSLR